MHTVVLKALDKGFDVPPVRAWGDGTACPEEKAVGGTALDEPGQFLSDIPRCAEGQQKDYRLARQGILN